MYLVLSSANTISGIVGYNEDMTLDDKLARLGAKKPSDMSKGDIRALVEEQNRMAQLNRHDLEKSPAATETKAGNAEGVRPSVDVSPSPDNERNEFGLPSGWARETSLAGLEEIRRRGHRAIKEVLLRSFQDLKRFGNTDDFGSPDCLNENSPEETAYLAKSLEDKIGYCISRFPAGLTISKAGVFAKWEEILPYELWAIRNHDQTLCALNQRGGILPGEAAAIIWGVHYRNKIIESVPDKKIVDWLRSSDLLKT